MCVPQRWKCDGDKDCLDGADESVKAGCSEWNNYKITLENVVSGKRTKPYQPSSISVHQRVFFSLPVYTNSTCDDNEFMCQDRECIPKHFVCDHDIDCSDGSDESPECGEWL